MTMTLSKPTRRQPGWFIPWIFVVGFLVVLIPNGLLIHYALSSWTGLTTEHAFEEGVAYNRTLAAARAQEQLGWQARIDFVSREQLKGELEVSLTDREGRPLNGAEVAAQFVRPTSGGHDRSLKLEERGGGRYGATVALDLPGNWDLLLLAQHGGNPYRKSERVWVKQ